MHADWARGTKGHHSRQLWHRTEQNYSLFGYTERCIGYVGMETRLQRHLSTTKCDGFAAELEEWCIMGDFAGAQWTMRMRSRGGKWSLVSAVHVGYDEQTEGCSATNCWPLGQSDLYDEHHLWDKTVGCVVGSIWFRQVNNKVFSLTLSLTICQKYRLGRWSFIHLLRTTVVWRNKCHVRGKTRANAGSWPILPHNWTTQSVCAFLHSNLLPRYSARRSGCQVRQSLQHWFIAHYFRSWRTLWFGDEKLDRQNIQSAGAKPLVAK